MPDEYPELSTMAASVYRSEKRTPAELRSCTGAVCPRKKTVSGSSLEVMSAALRITSLPAESSARTAQVSLSAAGRSTARIAADHILARVIRAPLRMARIVPHFKKSVHEELRFAKDNGGCQRKVEMSGFLPDR